MVQRSDFSLAKIQGASGLALGPCVLFSVLVGCLVSGLAVAGVGGCGCRCVLLIFGGGGRLLAGLLAELAVAERVLRRFLWPGGGCARSRL